MVIESIKMVFKVFINNKLRTVLTMLGIYIGIVSIVLILSLSDATKQTIKKELSNVENSIITIGLRKY